MFDYLNGSWLFSEPQADKLFSFIYLFFQITFFSLFIRWFLFIFSKQFLVKTENFKLQRFCAASTHNQFPFPPPIPEGH